MSARKVDFSNRLISDAPSFVQIGAGSRDAQNSTTTSVVCILLGARSCVKHSDIGNGGSSGQAVNLLPRLVPTRITARGHDHTQASARLPSETGRSEQAFG